jgi:hypothetical protein
MAHDPAPVDESVHRPAKLDGGGIMAGVFAGAAPSTAGRSLLPQAASRAAQTMIGRSAMRDVMGRGCEEEKRYGDYG